MHLSTIGNNYFLAMINHRLFNFMLLKNKSSYPEGIRRLS